MLKINKDYRISRLDKWNLIIEQHKIINKRDGNTDEEWIICGYYGSLEGALNGLLKKELFDTPEQEIEIKDIKTLMEKYKNEIIEAVKTYNVQL